VVIVVGMATITIDNRTKEAVQMPKLSAENKKFEFTGETIEVKGANGEMHTLYRIRAKKDFTRVLGPDITMEVRAGDLGGFIEEERNLDFSEGSKAWVADSAQVCEKARVRDNAVVRGHVIASGNAEISGNADVSDDVIVQNSAMVYEDARLRGHVLAAGESKIHGSTQAFDYANFHDNTEVYGHVKAYEHAGFWDYSRVSGPIEVLGHVQIRGIVQITSETAHMRITEGDFYFGIINSNEKLKTYLEEKEKIDWKLLHARMQELRRF